MKIAVIILLVFTTAILGWFYSQREFMLPSQRRAIVSSPPPHEQTAYFAGGCFWCVEADFEKIPGVTAVVSGYAGGHLPDPTYKDVTSQTSGHREAVEVRYDPAQVSYRDLVEYFFAHIDPTDAGGQFVDRGESYTSAIFYRTEEEGRIAREVVQLLTEAGIYEQPIVTTLLPFVNFYPAEEYHQDYYKKHPMRYAYYRAHSGRDARVEAFCRIRAAKGMLCTLPKLKTAPTSTSVESSAVSPWRSFRKPDDATLRQTLSPLAYQVTQEGGTEAPFQNAYWDNKEEGIYVDVLSGEPLFSSRDKYDSGTGWPSFTKPIHENAVTLHDDYELFVRRTEVKSAIARSHLGHVFDDGPAPLGKRWCINSAALRFIPREHLSLEGYGEYERLFSENSEKEERK